MKNSWKTASLLWVTLILTASFLAQGVSGQLAVTKRSTKSEIWTQVEIIRTAYGVPHIRAANMRAAGYALAWIQCEDYGTSTPMSILQSSGRWSSVEGGSDQIESDFFILRHR